jgi:osmoprotectant transport system substrate-binding protein
MRQVYPLPLAGDLITMDLGLLYRALDANQVDLIAANSTDPLLASGRYRVLEDDRSFFPPYETCIAARQSALARWPKLGAAFDQLQGRVNESAMRRLNAQVVLQGRRADEVAREFAQTLWGGSNHG